MPCCDEQVAIRVRDLVAVAMPLADLGDAVDLGGARAAREPARIRAEAHRAAHVGDVLLRFHQRDDRVVALGRELAASGCRRARSTLRANSMIAVCMPRQMPKNGTP